MKIITEKCVPDVCPSSGVNSKLIAQPIFIKYANRFSKVRNGSRVVVTLNYTVLRSLSPEGVKGEAREIAFVVGFFEIVKSLRTDSSKLTWLPEGQNGKRSSPRRRATLCCHAKYPQLIYYVFMIL